ncbi:MAG: hypothetical protein COY38_05055 [Candidatus Aenigmarchaeota archaeon CG_4_10_14_0_8_um_filter_37_24]|nr:glycosyltransferase [Candidatus Aenigmarchaeota archaeon]PIV68247.1 MAG: hypothetical protein COS07_04715 [Candidatus Aenigmarchaeota archaeon CG01_land_8_20_14_3_00_37_9]PIW40875.1 MAG: hypothetical protein COW21_04850 [Candidatus Aenigmarchaeota archaeon CG15_BIG_FIL_POST_REV_8_21_14_020_37_27]PIX50228.1 MAG: hypothetical protein COZ52_05155 [Candidatus Aenigmarchaeota archaeon CG_4_8_14_3_um_filter_37_24]PIY36434.1 MAG: hypothetical protein COZ04_00300 [Candidatus Aenigmarchaeota archaeon
MNFRKVSIIVPAYNAEKTIELCLKSLLNQSYQKNKYEILVVDDGSKDKTKNIIRKFNRVKLIEQNHRGPSVARNLGAKKSKNDLILFIDSDCIAPKYWIKNIIKPFKDKDVIAVSGAYKTKNKDKLIARFVGFEIEERHKKLGREIDFVSTFSAAYLRKIYLKVGGLDEKFTRASADDTSLSFKLDRLGKKMIFEPKAYVYHHHPDNLKKYLKRKFWMGYWRVFLYRDFKEKFMRHSYTPKTVYFRIALTGIALLAFLFSLFGFIPFSIFSFLILFLILTTIPFSAKVFIKDISTGLLSPIIIILRDFVSGLGIVFGLVNLILKRK